MGKLKEVCGGTWRALWPFLLYEAISSLAVALAAFSLDFGMLEALLLSELLGIPVFWFLYRWDKTRGKAAASVPLKPHTLFWAVSGSAALAFLSSEFLLRTPLPEWSYGYQEASSVLTSGSLWLQLLTVSVAAPVLEELVMRGVLYGRLRAIVPVKKAIVCSALVFGICHGNLVQGFHAFVLGILLAWLMERFQNILVPILGHAAANAVSLLAVPEGEPLFYALEIVLCAVCVWRMVRVLGERVL